MIRDAIASGPLVRRFLAERQILASLEHPGIARLLDGGITAEGLPWFALEYVDGVPITRYCDERRLGLAARLELFLQVCDAVVYAHRNLIVHRDLKPSNILVTPPSDGATSGRVRLLDFGIARLIVPEPGAEADGAAGPGAGAAGGRGGLTRTGVVPLTPEYASPEQLRLEPVSTASDVYQLGILLYELLAGRRPHRLGGLTLHEIQRVVLETRPEAPSTAVTRADAAAHGTESTNTSGMRTAGSKRAHGADGTAAARSSTPARLRRRLRGDLDNIALTALRPSVERRYASVERLADDVRRHLRREPVSARPDTVLYRAGRFVRRHRIAVAAAALSFLLLAGFAGAMAVQAGRLAQERDRAEHATAFLVDLFEGFEPIEARGTTVAVPDVLRRGLERARTELADQPLLRARVLDVIAHVYTVQGMHAQAEPLLEEALAARYAVLGHAHLDVAASRRRLADLRYERR